MVSFPLAGAVDLPRHVDPRILESENPLSSQLFFLYGSVFDSIISGRHLDARSLADTVKKIYVPPNSREVLESFNGLLVEAIEAYESTDISLHEARGHLRWLRETAAETSLNQAILHIFRANSTVSSLGDASYDVASLLGASPTQLQNGVDDLILRLEEYRYEISGAQEEVENIIVSKNEGLRDAHILIEADTQEVLVGEGLTISGILSDDDGDGLPLRNLDIIFDMNHVLTITTDEEGFFSTEIETPYIYADSASIYAEFWPDENDVNVLMPTSSNTIIIGLNHFRPFLSVQLPESVYPSKTSHLNGQVTYSGEALEGLSLKATFLGQTWVNVSNENGYFEFSLLTPPDALEGIVQVVISTVPRGEYGPVVVVRTVQIRRLPLKIDYEVPSWMLSGGKVKIEGSVTLNEEPLDGCIIEVKGSDQIVHSSIQKDGSFSSYLSYPYNTLSSEYGFSLKVTQQEPWISPATVYDSLLVINVVALVGFPCFLGVTVIYGFQKLRRSKSSRQSEEKKPSIEYGSESLDLKEKDGFEGIYFRAVSLISSFTSTFILRNHTIREYLAVIKGKLGSGLYNIFERLSLIYERWIYGSQKFESQMEYAENLLDEMKDKSKIES